MKTSLRSLVFAAACAAALVSTPAQAKVEVGQPAPDFSLTDITGATHKLSDFRGKVVVLEWVNPGCPVVQRHYNSGNMQSTQKSAVADGAVWLSINSGHAGAQGDLSNDNAAAWLKKQDAATTAYFRDSSGKVGRLYGAKATPHMYVISTEGTLVYQGAIDDNPSAKPADTMKSHNYVKAALASIKAGTPVEKSATQAYGCAVKYGNDS